MPASIVAKFRDLAKLRYGKERQRKLLTLDRTDVVRWGDKCVYWTCHIISHQTWVTM